MEKVKNYISSLSVMLGDVFSETETTVRDCSITVDAARESRKNAWSKSDNRMNVIVSSLKESVSGLATLFQFGDIIDQSFESFDVIFEEMNNLKNNDAKLTHENAERFSKLVGAVSTNTFSLIGTTLLQLKEKLESARKMLVVMRSELENCENTQNAGELLFSVDKSLDAVLRNIEKIEHSARYAVLSTESVGLFCLETIVSRHENIENLMLAERLYERFRVREHVKILNSIFPTTKEYSETGSIEFF